MKPAVLTFAGSGRDTAARIAELIGGEVLAGEAGQIRRLFGAGRPIVGVCAAGILIRILAPLLSDKTVEPPVLAVSQDGGHVVPLLGGHHGANRLAREIAATIGGSAALTTASDSRFSRGLDEPPAGYRIADPVAAKPAMAALLGGETIALTGDAPWLAQAGYPIAPDGAVAVSVTERLDAEGLVYHPATLLAGMGCERGAGADEVIALLEATLAEAGLSPKSLAAIGTIALKADEPALHAAARHFGVPLRLFTSAELAAERERLENPSAIVEAETGTPGVAEAAALKAGRLIMPKRKSARATCAIGLSEAPLDPASLGRAPGYLHIVGIGPGAPETRTAAAVAALEASGDWVGYGLYLDLIADLATGQQEHRFPLGDEEVRVRHAIELAATGRTVALVCSGDAQIYAMAALVFELLSAQGERALSEDARRVAVESHPGISALQAASAAAGALLGHDFCAISLSDLLTPREDILKRLEGAAASDFVTAFYNPRSQRRTDLIIAAKSIFMAHRPPETPVIVASSLGRPDEMVTVTTLSRFDPESIDMLTIVLIGASSSRAFTRGDGRTVAFTPRGYARKAGLLS
ncbi:precorrin-3B C(17)-methyltransferase [Arsenicitalea aurantiaca]|uniref:Precorrin-3B C(17)-methyltransferase n=2 Tax=Arsenicitalea aurantiaca TaxID=1783274 RepID=A0A433X4D3_9HYPH|nr:precorrin-3B C(17)-methyltransferase [Arsenicitalea aurantiaca]